MKEFEQQQPWHETPIRVIGLEVNPEKDPTGTIKLEVLKLLKEFFQEATIQEVSSREKNLEIPLAKIDLYVVLGGDGTFLASARRLHGLGVPMIGINIGTLGFLTAVEYKDLGHALEMIQKGQYTIEERHMLTAQFEMSGQREEFVAMNDVVVTKGSLGRMMTYQVYIDGHHATTFRGDGVVFATPTGSTAYNLSAGGPIVYPTIKAISMTAICPHSLGVRNLIISGDSKILVKVSGDVANYNLSVDGQQNFNIEINRSVRIEDSGHTARIIRLDNYDYFDVLNEKIVNKA